MEVEMGKNSSHNTGNNSNGPNKILIEFISNYQNNKQWLNFAASQLFSVPELYRPECLDPEDYVSEAKTFLLENVEVIGDAFSTALFLLTLNNKTLRMNQRYLKQYVFLLIKWKLSRAVRKQKKIVRFPDNEGIEEEELVIPRAKLNSDYIVKFNDPFDENLKYKSKEFIDLCLRVLEKKNQFYKIIFDDRLNGMSNKDIAGKYKITVRKVENYIKKIFRYLRSILWFD